MFVLCRPRGSLNSKHLKHSSSIAFSTKACLLDATHHSDVGKLVKGDFSALRDTYETPRHPIVLAHGLFGFDELHLVGGSLPGVQYWRGLRQAFAQRNIEVIVTSVPSSGSIEARAARLAESIEEKAGGKKVNIIAHSMGGLDSRYMISQLKPPNVAVMSLTTIATPHHGSAFADYIFNAVGPYHKTRLYKAMESVGMETGAFSQLTREYMEQTFNPNTPDLDGVRYYSYGATLRPTIFSIFHSSHQIIKRLEEAENDGLVSIPSSQWGVYKGTLTGVSHLDLINWTNRVKWLFREMFGLPHHFNAVAFYLSIADTLAKEGL